VSDGRTLRVPGGRLHSEVRGSGPALLMIPGSNGDAWQVVDLPGDHTGYWSRPAEFAAALADVLAGQER
jgi:hypothetical protein